MNAYAVIRAAIPGADDELCDYVLWKRTRFPFDGSPRTIYECARRWQRSRVPLCETCDRPALKDQWHCDRCSKILEQANG